MANKKIIRDKPYVGDISQYNFSPDDDVMNYEDSIGLPNNTDKFTKKDLYTKVVDSELNRKIIERNLKFAGDSYVRIDKMKIDNAGVNSRIKNCRIQCYLFSREKLNPFNSDGTVRSYNSLVTDSNWADTLFYTQNFGNRGRGRGLGVIENFNGTTLTTNITTNDPPEFNPDSIANFVDSYKIEESLLLDGATGAGETETFGTDSGDTLLTSIFNETQNNPIYLAVWMRGDRKAWWGTDGRKKRIQIFEINNTELFQTQFNPIRGLITTLNFGYGDSSAVTGGSNSRGVTAAAFKLTELQISISTLPGEDNDFDDFNDYKKYIDSVLPPATFEPNDLDPLTFLSIGPERQLINDEPSGFNWSGGGNDAYVDFFPITYVGIVNNSKQIDISTDLQNFYEDDTLLSLKASAPSTIGVKFHLFPLDGDLEVNEIDFNTTSVPDINGEFYYYVVDWNDVDNKFEKLEDALDDRPIDLFELKQKQENNLYKIYRQHQKHNDDNPNLSLENLQTTIENNYNTPGIKTIKVVMFGYDRDRLSATRWKLVTIRFYLDIPVNQFPDFGEVGGSDFSTIPWPYTTPVIGGVSQDSKYKTSVQDTLSGGKIGDTDIIDEKFLINDLENDEIGESILSFDLEQCRYFNQSYDMNTLLNLQTIRSDSWTYYLVTPQHLQTLSGFYGEGMTELELALLNIQGWRDYGRPDIADYIENGSNPLNNPINYLDDQEENIVFGDPTTGGIEGVEYGEPHLVGGSPYGTPPGFGGGGSGGGGTTTDDDDDSSTVDTDSSGNYDIIYPTGGQKYESGDSTWGTVPIRWQQDSISDAYTVNIQLLKKLNNGQLQFIHPISNNTGGEVISTQEGEVYREYLWTVPEDIPYINSDTNYVIAIYRNPSGLVSDTMDDTFQLVINNFEDEGQVDTGEEDELIPEFGTDDDVARPLETFANPIFYIENFEVLTPYNDPFWQTSTSGEDGRDNFFPMESSVGQIFISDNLDLDLKQSCKLELNTGNLTGKSIDDSSGNGNKGLLIGDYKVKKRKKGEPMRRDSFIKIPKKTSNSKGAL